jgi:hypothetical protein
MRFRCELGTEMLKIDGMRLQRDKRMSQLWSCVQPTIPQFYTHTIFTIFMCIDYTAVLSYVGSTVTVALFSQPESCVISGLRRGVKKFAFVLGNLRSAELSMFRDNLSVPSSRIKQSIVDRKERRSQSESTFK